MNYGAYCIHSFVLLKVLGSSLTSLQVRSLTDNIPVILDALRSTSTVVEVQVSYGCSICLVMHLGRFFFFFFGGWGGGY